LTVQSYQSQRKLQATDDQYSGSDSANGKVTSCKSTHSGGKSERQPTDTKHSHRDPAHSHEPPRDSANGD
jgi:hypothetical protein